MKISLFVLSLLFLMISIGYFFRAAMHRTAAQRSWIRIGVFPRRDTFTSEGWKFQRTAILFGALALMVGVIWVLITEAART